MKIYMRARLLPGQTSLNTMRADSIAISNCAASELRSNCNRSRMQYFAWWRAPPLSGDPSVIRKRNCLAIMKYTLYYHHHHQHQCSQNNKVYANYNSPTDITTLNCPTSNSTVIPTASTKQQDGVILLLVLKVFEGSAVIAKQTSAMCDRSFFNSCGDLFSNFNVFAGSEEVAERFLFFLLGDLVVDAPE